MDNFFTLPSVYHSIVLLCSDKFKTKYNNYKIKDICDKCGDDDNDSGFSSRWYFESDNIITQTDVNHVPCNGLRIINEAWMWPPMIACEKESYKRLSQCYSWYAKSSQKKDLNSAGDKTWGKWAGRRHRPQSFINWGNILAGLEGWLEFIWKGTL